MVSILQYYHFKHSIYSNLSPKHTMIGKGEKCDNFFIVDYSRSNRYRDSQNL